MSDHISKKNQAEVGHAHTTGIKLKPVTGATKLILDAAKAAVAGADGNDKVPDSDREMDLTFYDANGNIETADPGGDVSMEDDTAMHSVEHDDDTSSSVDASVSVDTSFTTASDDSTDLDGDSIMQSIERNDNASSSIEELFSSDTGMTNADDASDEHNTADSDPEVSVASLPLQLLDGDAREHSVGPAKDSEHWVSVENRAYYSEDDGEDYEYEKYAFRQKKLRLKNQAQRSKKPPSSHPKGGKGVRLNDGSMVSFNEMNQRCDEKAPDGDSEMP